MEKESIRGKRKARKLALQALYQWLMSEAELSDIEAQFRLIHAMDKVDCVYFCRLLYGIPEQVQDLEQELHPYLDRAIAELNPIERTVLRISAFELLHCLEIPYKVILDESVMLTKEFGSQDGYRYVNGVLNNFAKVARSVEINCKHENE